MIRSHRIVTGVFTVAVVGALFFRVGIVGAKPADAASPGPGLWVGSANYISEFQGRSLQRGGDPRARLVFRSKDFSDPQSIIVDRQNNLWISYFGVNDNGGDAPVVEFKRSQIGTLAGRRDVKPHVTLRAPLASSVPFVSARSLAFDSAGDLWIADDGLRVIEEFLPTQIAHSGAPSPTLSITTNGSVPELMVFDAADNLWVAWFANAQQLCRFSPTDRAVSGPANPGLVVNLSNAVGPEGLAIDPSGNIWIAGNGPGGDAVEMLSAADLSGSGEITPVPTVTITSAVFGPLIGPGSCLGGIAFDKFADLWVSVNSGNSECKADSQVVQFTPDQLSAGGNLTPALSIGENSEQTNLFLPGPIGFGPKVP